MGHFATSTGPRRAAWLPWAGVLAALAWSFVRAPATVTPALDTILAAAQAWPQRLPDPFSAFYTDSPFALLAARLVGGDARAYLWLMLATTTATVALLAWWAARAAGNEQRWRAARLSILLPVSAVLFGWLGFYDPFTLLAWAVVLFAWMSGWRSLLAAAGLLLGFQHFEHGLLGLAALVLAWFGLRDRLPRPIAHVNPAWALPGVVVGKVLLTLVLVLSGADASGRTTWLSTYLADWTKTAINVGPLLLWSLFAGAWALVVALWLHEPARRNRVYLASAFAVGLVATVLSGDRPRVFVIVLAPALLLAVVAYLRRNDHHRHELALVETVMWLGPPIALWGKVVVSANVADQLSMTWSLLTG